MKTTDIFKKFTTEEIKEFFKDYENVNLLHDGMVYKIINVKFFNTKKTKWFKTHIIENVYYEVYSYMSYSYVPVFYEINEQSLFYAIIHVKEDKESFRLLQNTLTDLEIDEMFEKNEVKQSFSDGHKTVWEKDGVKTIFDNNLYRKIRKIRENFENSLSDDDNLYNQKIENHEYTDFKIMFPNRNDKAYFVDSVYKQWDKGYYLLVLYYTLTERGDKSHGTFFWKNINSQCPFIKSYINENIGIKFINPKTNQIHE